MRALLTGLVLRRHLTAPHPELPHPEHVEGRGTKSEAPDAFAVRLARELATQGIHVSAVAPGAVHTDIHATAGDPNRPARGVSRIPMARLGEPEEVAEAILWLLSDAVSYTSGAVLRVSGGL